MQNIVTLLSLWLLLLKRPTRERVLPGVLLAAVEECTYKNCINNSKHIGNSTTYCIKNALGMNYWWQWVMGL